MPTRYLSNSRLRRASRLTLPIVLVGLVYVEIFLPPAAGVLSWILFAVLVLVLAYLMLFRCPNCAEQFASTGSTIRDSYASFPRALFSNVCARCGHPLRKP
jgi:hypothetical protein